MNSLREVNIDVCGDKLYDDMIKDSVKQNNNVNEWANHATLWCRNDMKELDKEKKKEEEENKWAGLLRSLRVGTMVDEESTSVEDITEIVCI